ncbi:MAG TPA: Lrp/AsnC family transcriptional regulator, partial [Brevundimonas sp.]|nr:Lrp/AsnC family transcriptional regulator [Brevundimonas sp.]
MTMKNHKQITLDEFDKRLLRAVQRDGSLTHAQLAEVVHLSPSQCARRLERLRKDGYL